MLLMSHAIKLPPTHSDLMNEQSPKHAVLNSPAQFLATQDYGSFRAVVPNLGSLEVL